MNFTRFFNSLFVKYLLFSLLMLVNALLLSYFSKSEEFRQQLAFIVLLIPNMVINYLFYRFFLKKWNLNEKYKDFFIYGTSLFFVFPSLFSTHYFKDKDRKIIHINSIQELENATNDFYKISNYYIDVNNYYLIQGMVGRGKGGRRKDVSANYVFPLYNDRLEEDLSDSSHIFLGVTIKKDFHASILNNDSYIKRKRKELDSTLALEYANFEIDTSAYFEKITFFDHEDNYLLEAAQLHRQFDDSKPTIIIKPLNRTPQKILKANLIGFIVSHVLGFCIPLIALLIAFRNKNRLSNFFYDK